MLGDVPDCEPPTGAAGFVNENDDALPSVIVLVSLRSVLTSLTADNLPRPTFRGMVFERGAGAVLEPRRLEDCFRPRPSFRGMVFERGAGAVLEPRRLEDCFRRCLEPRRLEGCYSAVLEPRWLEDCYNLFESSEGAVLEPRRLEGCYSLLVLEKAKLGTGDRCPPGPVRSSGSLSVAQALFWSLGDWKAAIVYCSFRKRR
eukprot:s3863_g7.t1